MKYLCLNLKRFDVSQKLGGVNHLCEPKEWGTTIVSMTQAMLKKYGSSATFKMDFPEAHLMQAVEALQADSVVEVGCQSVYRADVQAGGNFGAFTTNRPAAAMKAMGVTTTIIGHCEERADKAGILAEAGVTDSEAVNRILNAQMRCALEQGLDVTYCIGEKQEERDHWQDVLKQQLAVGLEGLDRSKIIIAYEPIWAIGPGKTPPDASVICEIAKFIKSETNGMVVIYGGGLKQNNAAMLASIDEIDGGLIALTRFAGEIGFYPDEYLDIIGIYMDNIQ